MPRRAQRLLSTVLAVALTALLASIAVFGGAVPSAQAAIQDPFAQVFSVNANGDIAIIGNTLQTCSTTAGANTGDCVSDRTTLAATTNGLNNNHTMQFVDVDSNAATFNSSSATLTVPTDGTVLFAALVWSGRTGATAVAGADPAQRATVQLSVPGGASAQTITGTTAGPTTGTSQFYQGYKDVTSIVAAAGSGSYTVANVQSQTNAVDRYAGWALVVALGDPNAPKRNLTVFKGLADLATNGTTTQDFTVSGFLTPPQGAVRTTVGVVAYEGDRSYVGDSMSINGVGISNAANPANDIFNSTITTNGVDLGGRTPNYQNQLGFDADLFVAPAGAIGNSATSATIRLTTASETYYPGVVTFATDLYDPKLNAVKNATLTTDADNSGTVTRGDTLEYTVDVQNDGLDTAVDSVFFDAIPTGTTFVPGSLVIDTVGQTDAADTDAGDYDASGANGHVTARLGIGATSAAGGEIRTISTNPTDKHTVKFSVLVNTSAVPAQGLVNAANVSYAGKTTGARAASVSNIITRVIPPVQAANQPPVAPDRTLSFTPTTAAPSLSVNVLGLASDPEGNALTLVGVTDAAGGTVTVVNGVATYTPGPSFAGRDVFTYTVQDSFGNRSTGVVRVDVINTPPVAVDEARNISHLAPTTLNLVGNDTDDNGDALSVRSISANGVGPITSGSITTSKGGALTIANGVVTYSPPTGGLPLGQTEAFTYVVQDARGGSDDGSVVLTSANSAPVAVDDTDRTNAGTPVTISPLGNDTDADTDPLIISPAPADPAHGTVAVINGGTQLRYTPNPGYVGTDVITYTISDGRGGTATASVTVTVNGPPVANADAVNGPGDQPVSVNVATNDTDPNGHTLTVTAVGAPLTGTGTSAGSVTFSGGSVQFTPVAGFVGDTTVSYTVSDGTQTATSQVTFTISNIAPTVPATPVSATTGTNMPIAVNVLENVDDSNVDGGYQTLTTTGVTVDNGATYVIETDGTVTVTPANGYKGAITLEYTASDGTASVTGRVTVFVTDAAPTAAPDARTTPTNTSVLVNALANDSDPNGNVTLSIQSFTAPTDAAGASQGLATVAIENGQLRYTPPTGFAGVVTFDYTITDGTTPATSTITVTVSNAAPVANPNTATTPSDTAAIVDVLGNDTDANIPGTTQVLSVTTATGDNGSTVTIGADGRLTVTPVAGFAGAITVTYVISDGATGTASSTLVLTVQNAPPTPVADQGSTVAGRPATVNLLGNDTDSNGDTLTVTSFTQAVDANGVQRGTVTVSPAGVATVTPFAGYLGTLSFDYTVDDGKGGTATATASVVVSAAPVVTAAGGGSGSGSSANANGAGANGLALTGGSPTFGVLLAAALLLIGAAFRLRSAQGRRAGALHRG